MALPVTQHALDVGERIRASYIKAGYNRNKFCRLLDVNYTTIYNWEKGVRLPSATNLEAIGAATGATVQWLLTGEETPPDARSAGLVSPGYQKAAEKAWSDFERTNKPLLSLLSDADKAEIRGIKFRAGAPASASFYVHIAMALLDHHSGAELADALDAEDITPEDDGSLKRPK